MIDKVAGVIVKNKKLLVVRKRTKENYQEFIIPGGKREIGETDIDTLKRELKEELLVDVVNAEYMGTYHDIAVFEKVPITVHTYIVQIQGEILCNSEIKEYIWIDNDYKKQNIKIGSILEKYIIPQLIECKLL